MGFEALYDNASVRRRDRLLSAEEAAGVLRRGEYGFLAMQDAGGGAYGVPISYVWDGGSRIYLHCAPGGAQAELPGRQPEVTFCVGGDACRQAQVHDGLRKRHPALPRRRGTGRGGALEGN